MATLRNRIGVFAMNMEKRPVYVRLRPKNSPISHAIDLLHEERPISVHNGEINIMLLPEDSADYSFAIIEIVTQLPIVRFLR